MSSPASVRVAGTAAAHLSTASCASFSHIILVTLRHDQVSSVIAPHIQRHYHPLGEPTYPAWAQHLQYNQGGCSITLSLVVADGALATKSITVVHWLYLRKYEGQPWTRIASSNPDICSACMQHIHLALFQQINIALRGRRHRMEPTDLGPASH